MKRVFSKTIEVAEIWAAQSQSEARTGSNTWMRDTALGSYGTVIARIVDGKDGPVALISEERYSNTTAVVIGQAIAAARRNNLAVFEVQRLYESPEAVNDNLERYKVRIDAELDRIERARVYTADTYRRAALALIGEAMIYARTFGCDWKWHGRNPLRVLAKAERKAEIAA